MNDKDLINGLKKYDERCFNEFVQSSSKLILKVLSCILKDGHESNYIEDAYNEVLTCIWKNIDTFKEQSSFKTWIIAITKYKALDFKRRFKKTNEALEIDDNILPTEDSVESTFFKKVSKENFKEILLPLKDIDKDIFSLYYLHGYNAKTISKLLHLSEDNVFKRMSRGRKKLKDYYNSIENFQKGYN